MTNTLRSTFGKGALLAAAALTAIQIASFVPASEAYAATPSISVSVDGIAQTGWKVKTIEKTAFVPVRLLATAVGATVAWDEATGTVTLTQGTRIVQLTVKSKTALVNGNKTALKLTPVQQGGTLWVPAAAAGRLLGAAVAEDSSASKLSITPRLHPFDNGDKQGFVNVYGETVIPAQYEEANGFHEGLAIVKQDGKYGYINALGEAVIPLQFDKAYDFSDGVALVEKDGAASYINAAGKTVLSPTGYDELYDFSEGLALVRKGDLFGYIDHTGKEIVPVQFEDAFYFSEGVAAVQVEGRYGYIDRTGATVIKPIYQSAFDFEGGLGLV
ncbi:MAG: WG repeat-containing protein, partial [Cohnella sp.]|nr:WG repeat-containing protein [Cohnella sp.]